MSLEETQYTISGTEEGALLGLNPYMSPMDLFMRKLGLIDPPPETEAMRWGSAAEHVVARRYARETGNILYPSTDGGYDYNHKLVHPKYPWWVGTPDRAITVKDKPVGLLEIKIVGERMAHQWGEAPDGDVPEFYVTQCLWYMPILNVEWADLAVQIGNRDYRVYRINRDRELENQLRDAALAFINDHLIPQVPPPIDASESSKRWLNYKYPANTEDILEPDSVDVLDVVYQFKDIQAQIKDLERQESYFTNLIKTMIGDAAGLQGEFGKIYWRRSKDTKKVDWENLALSFLPKAEDIEKFTKVKPGSRVFRTYFKEDL